MSFVLDELKKLVLPKDSFVVVGSGLLDVLGIRKAQDIDIIVSETTFQELKNSDWKTVEKPEGIALQNGAFEAALSWDSKDGRPNFSELLERSVGINGYHFSNLNDLLVWKKKKGRPKDLQDVQLINDYLKRES